MSKVKIRIREGGEIYEMDVSPCNSLLNLWFVALVLSKTLNGSSEGKGINEELKGRQFFAGLYYSLWKIENFPFARSQPQAASALHELFRPHNVHPLVLKRKHRLYP